MKQEQGLTRNQIFSELARSPHGKLEEYFPLGRRACGEDPEFFSHLIAWNHQKGHIRDAKMALPLVALDVLRSNGHAEPEFVENAEAHLASLDPRSFAKAVRFVHEQKLHGRRQALKRLVEKRLRAWEANARQFDRLALNYTRWLKDLYALHHIKAGARADRILFKRNYPQGSVFGVLPRLRQMKPVEVAAAIGKHKIPTLIVESRLSKEQMGNPEILVALLNRMTPAQLTMRLKRLEKKGVSTNPALKAALEHALDKARKGGGSTLKLSQAAEAVSDEKLKAKVRATQEVRLSAEAVKGDWLVLADASSSMSGAIEAARHIAAVLARMAEGKVHLVFFNTAPRYLDATGKTLEQLEGLTRHVRAGGMTSVGVGLHYILEQNWEVDGIALISDGEENTNPRFVACWQKYQQKFGKDLPVYFYRFGRTFGLRKYSTDSVTTDCESAGIDIHHFDMKDSVDYYSLPNLVATMRTNRYSLMDEVMATPLLKLDQVLEGGKA